MNIKTFTDDEVRIIRKEFVDRKSSAKSPNIILLANRFGVSQETIRKIAKGKIYKKVQ
jgi:DNA-directed RNA polymerase sigma subunit (sigma70/sigma32)